MKSAQIFVFMFLSFLAIPIVYAEETETAEWYNHQGLLAYRRADRKEARKMFEASIKEATGQKSSLQAIIGYYYLGLIEKDDKNYKQAIELLSKAMIIEETTLFPQHPQLLKTYAALADVYAQENKYLEAATYYWKMLAIEQQLFGADQSGTLSTRANLLTLYLSHDLWSGLNAELKRKVLLGRSKIGKELCEEMERKVMGLISRDQYEDAAKLAVRVLELEAESKIKSNPSFYEQLQNLGAQYANKQEYEKACKLFENLLVCEEMSLPANNPDPITVRHALANCYSARKQFLRSEELYKQIIASLRSNAGMRYNCAATMADFADSYAEQGKYSQAESLAKEAVAMGLHSQKARVPDNALWALAKCYTQKKDSIDLLNVLMQLLSAKEKDPGEQQKDLGDILQTLGDVHFDMKAFSRAEQFCKRALTIRLKELSSNDPRIDYSNGALARCYIRQEKVDLAEPLISHMLKSYSRAAGKDKKELAQNLQYTISIMRSSGFKTWAAKLEAILSSSSP